MEEDDDAEAGPELPPDFDPEAPDDPDDEEGRFFGGGVQRQTVRAMDYVDEQEEEQIAVRV